ncbi:hypothetical protein cypCar_00047487, partial [Cyprinus carpio]
SAVGSGQSFSALQSGRFYCEAHNQHGSQRSDAVTVTVKGGHNGVLYTAVVIAVGCGVLFLICIIMFMRKRKGSAVSDVRQMQLQQPSSSDRNHFEDGLYANRTDQTSGKTPESTDTMKLKYTTIQHIRNNESNYENLRIHHPDSAVSFLFLTGLRLLAAGFRHRRHIWGWRTNRRCDRRTTISSITRKNGIWNSAVSFHSESRYRWIEDKWLHIFNMIITSRRINDKRTIYPTILLEKPFHFISNPGLCDQYCI